MARSIKEAWADYKRFYSQGFEKPAPKDLNVYPDATSRNKKDTVKKGSPVHVMSLKNIASYAPRIQIQYDTDKTGWVTTADVGKPNRSAGGKVTCKLKPQDFNGIAGVKMNFSTYYNKVLKAIDERDDLPQVLKVYLRELTDYCMHHGAADKKSLVDAYEALASTKYVGCMNDVEKDFSEITAPLCVLERGGASLKDYGMPNLNKNNGVAYIPVEGNYALIDFIIYDNEDRAYQFSVKKISKTTNVVKPQDIIQLLNKDGDSKWVKDYKKTFEYKILEILAENGSRVGPFKVLRLLANNNKTKNELPSEVVRGIDKMLGSSDDPDEEEVNLASDLWLKLAETFYPEGINYWETPKHSSGRVGLASLISQLTIEKLSKDKKIINYLDVVKEFVMREVVYYKFAAPGGIPNFYMENHLKNNIKSGDVFYLRCKSSIGNPYRDKLGVQP